MSQVLAPIISPILSIASGFSKAKAANTEAANLDRIASDKGLQAKQVSAIRREERNEALSTINAVRAARGLSIDSPGSSAIKARTRERADENENAEVLSIKNEQQTLINQAASKRRSAKFAVIGGFGKALTSIAGIEGK